VGGRQEISLIELYLKNEFGMWISSFSIYVNVFSFFFHFTFV